MSAVFGFCSSIGRKTIFDSSSQFLVNRVSCSRWTFLAVFMAVQNNTSVCDVDHEDCARCPTFPREILRIGTADYSPY